MLLRGIAFLSLALLLEAQQATVIEYPLATRNRLPSGIVAGPDGALWFTENGAGRIGRISTSGAIAEFTIPTPGGAPDAISAGSDGALWFTENNGNRIARITVSGAVTEYPLRNAGSYPSGITAGPDGALWFTENSGNRIGRITTSGSISEFSIPTNASGPTGIAAGSDGALWFTETSANKIARLTTGGTFTEYTLPGAGSSPTGIVPGPDGALWFTEFTGNRIGRITTSGAMVEFPLPSAGAPYAIAVGPDGALWITEFSGRIARLTTAGAVTEYTPPSTNSGPYGIAAGADGALWFTESIAGRIGRVLLGSVSMTLQPSTSALAFSYAPGGAIPAAQPLSVSSSGASLSVSPAVTSGSWLSVTPSSGTTPAAFSVAVNPTGLATGLYSGNVRLTSPGASNSPFDIPVSLTVGCRYSLTAGLAIPATGGSTAMQLATDNSCAWSVTGVPTWASCAPLSGAGPATITCSSGANPGTVSRTATLVIGGQNVAILQSAPAASTSALRFVPVIPCRVVDTRNPNGSFGGPILAANSARDFPIPAGACSIPTAAQAYALNVTVVPSANLGYLTLWPSGRTQPLVSTLNSDGRVKANAAIVGAGTNGAVRVFVTDATHLVLDIFGYFVPGDPGLAYYPVTPCRVADTRGTSAPSLAPASPRTFPVGGRCGVPASAQAYALNVTVVGSGSLGYLTLWPAGQSQPLVSTLNNPRATAVANAALVPAGPSGAVNAYATDTTDLILDVLGYFAAPGSPGALQYYSVDPCRIADTRNSPAGPFSQPALAAGASRDFAVISSACPVPATARAFALSATVVPAGPLGYLTLYPAGSSVPFVSTLNAMDGAITSNLALVGASTQGSISAFATSSTHLVLDINGYFAP